MSQNNGMEFAIAAVGTSGYEVCTRELKTQFGQLYAKSIEDFVPQEVNDWFVRTKAKAVLTGAIHINETVKLVYTFSNKQDSMMFKLAWG